MTAQIIIAVPKGRILKEVLPLFEAVGITPEAAFSDEDSRALRFATNRPDIGLIRVRAFDVATFVAGVSKDAFAAWLNQPPEQGEAIAAHASARQGKRSRSGCSNDRFAIAARSSRAAGVAMRSGQPIA